MSRARTTFSSAAWNHVGKILEYVLTYVSSVLIARGLGVEGNGVFAGLVSVAQLMPVLVSLGLETSLNKHIPQFSPVHAEENIRYILRRLILIRIALFIALVLLLLSFRGLWQEEFPRAFLQYLTLLLFLAGFRAITPLFAMALTARLRTALNTRITLAVRFIEALGIGVLILLGTASILSLIVLFAASSILHFLFYLLFARSQLVGPESPLPLSPLLIFGGIFWVNTISEFILGKQGDVLFLTILLHGSTQASLYDVAYSIAQLAALGLTIGLGGVTFATFASLALRSPETMNKFYSFLVRILSLLTIPLYAFLLFNGETVIRLAYSDMFVASFPLMQMILIFRLVSRLFGGPENAEYLLSRGRVASLVGVGLIGAVANLVLNIVLIPRLGGFGSTIASGIGNLAVNACAAGLVFGITRGSLQFGFWIKVTAICCVSSWLSHQLLDAHSSALLTGTVLLYAGLVLSLLAMTKPLTPSDTEWLSQMGQRTDRFFRIFTRPAHSF